MASDSKYEFMEQLFTVSDCTDFKYKVDVYPSVFQDIVILQLTNEALNF